MSMSTTNRRTVAVARTTEIPLGQARTFQVGDLDILVANVGGAFHAIDNLCSHDDGPLGEGNLHGASIECPRHGARFDVCTGKVLRMPAASPVRTYPVRIDGDQVLVEIGD